MSDFERAVLLSELYSVPLRVVNTAICRKNMGLAPYEPGDVQSLEEQISFFGDENNLKGRIHDPERFKELFKRYYEEVVLKHGYEPEIQKKISEVYSKITSYSFHDGTQATNMNDGPSFED